MAIFILDVLNDNLCLCGVFIVLISRVEVKQIISET